MRRIFSPSDVGRPGSLGLLLMRIVLGIGLAMHGYHKMGNAFNWMGADAWAPGFLQAISVFAEFGGGIAILLGLLTPLAALGVVIDMLVAIFSYHIPHGDLLVAPQGSGIGSYDLAALYGAAAFSLMMLGPGLFSLDAIFFKRKQVRTSAGARQRAAAR